jgi:hypothetical protein
MNSRYDRSKTMELILWRHADAEDAPASSKQGPAERGAGARLRDAHVRESGAVPSIAYVMGVHQPWN